MKDDLQHLIEGHIKNDYVFTGNNIAADNPSYRSDPNINDRVHRFVFVFDSCQPLIMESFLQQTSLVRDSLNDAKIPQLILMTKTDKLSNLIQDDLSTTFHSKFIQNKIQQFSGLLRRPAYSVLPMKNIHIEHIPSTNLKILTLYNLRHMLMTTAEYPSDNVEELQQDTYDRNDDVFSTSNFQSP
ncbi:Hypothetical predicted protein [Mytilus galloprovincialis]|uniref:Uncharacterized protein n=1 Tax=Mytilus galloprovincialis TaxID=29158 RepID=A0A8B6D2K6_MYTGA|nr:Hypothetical predicted protein [Mytilus galloprovincialis]